MSKYGVKSWGLKINEILSINLFYEQSNAILFMNLKYTTLIDELVKKVINHFEDSLSKFSEVIRICNGKWNIFAFWHSDWRW